MKVLGRSFNQYASKNTQYKNFRQSRIITSGQPYAFYRAKQNVNLSIVYGNEIARPNISFIEPTIYNKIEQMNRRKLTSIPKKISERLMSASEMVNLASLAIGKKVLQQRIQRNIPDKKTKSHAMYIH